MKVYHGSNKIIDTPTYGLGKSNNDYGKGFYMAEDFEIASLWASKYENGGYVNTYELNLEGLKILNLADSDEKDILRWIAILTKFRFSFEDLLRYKDRIDLLTKLFPVDLSNIDVVFGYRADDSYFSYSRDFLANDLSYEILSSAMKLGKLGEQIVLISRKSFNQISFLESKNVSYSGDYARLRKNVSNEYKKLKVSDSDENTFIRDILRKYNAKKM